MTMMRKIMRAAGHLQVLNDEAYFTFLIKIMIQFYRDNG